MQSRRVNLTLAEGDYQRLVEAARSDGKLPAAFAADVLKAFLMRELFKGSLEPVQAPQVAFDRPAAPPVVLDLFDAPEPALSRQQRRAAEREKKKR